MVEVEGNIGAGKLLFIDTFRGNSEIKILQVLCMHSGNYFFIKSLDNKCYTSCISLNKKYLNSLADLCLYQIQNELSP